jgi:hypothetical protein
MSLRSDEGRELRYRFVDERRLDRSVPVFDAEPLDRLDALREILLRFGAPPSIRSRRSTTITAASLDIVSFGVSGEF